MSNKVKKWSGMVNAWSNKPIGCQLVIKTNKEQEKKKANSKELD